MLVMIVESHAKEETIYKMETRTVRSDEFTQSNPAGYQTPLGEDISLLRRAQERNPLSDNNVLQAFIEGMEPDVGDRLDEVAARARVELTPLLERLCVVSPWRSSRRGVSVEQEVARMQCEDVRFIQVARQVVHGMVPLLKEAGPLTKNFLMEKIKSTIELE